jgi:8-amino-7-oxononanoate synthase
LARPGSVVVSDTLNHASLIDGCRLSRARVAVVPHRDTQAVARALESSPEADRLVVTDSYFSMDGHVADLRALRSICDEHRAALLVDEAHALGVWGPEGRGVASAQGVVPDVLIGTLGKSFGGQGAFAAASSQVLAWLWNQARSFVFSTGLSPLLAQAAMESLAFVRDGALTQRLHERVASLRGALAEEGVRPMPDAEGPIVPILLPDGVAADTLRQDLLGHGVLAQPIRPPTVPRGTSRLRLTVQAGHLADDLRTAAAIVRSVLR